MRAHERDVAKWHPATGLTNDGSEPFSVADLEPYYDRVERVLGVRERADWTKSVYTVEPGFRALGAELEPVHVVHGRELHELRLLHPGVRDERGQVDDEHVHRRRPRAGRSRAARERRGRAGADRRLRRRPGSSTSTAPASGTRCAPARSSSPAGALNTPQLLLRSGLANRSVGRHLGVHPVRLVYGLFDEPQDAHMVYPITAHCMKFQHDEDGGFVIEATTIQDPISFATTLVRRERAALGTATRRGA